MQNSKKLNSYPTENKLLIVNQAADAIVLGLNLPTPLGKGAKKEMAEKALNRLVDQYEGTRVSHLFWNTCYQRAAYASDVWASYLDLEDPEKLAVKWPRLYYLLHKLGINDVFELLITRSRDRGISPWVSLRMNDMHYNEDPNLMNPFWNEHPEYWILKKPGFDNGFNFTIDDVQTHYLKIIRESFFRWDVDGVELDWMRFPNLFRAGGLATGRSAITELMRKVRVIADEAAGHHGHSVEIAVRVPATPKFAFGLGLDAQTWMREGLVDILIPGSHWRPSFPDTPVSKWKTIAGDCQVVPATDLWMGGVPGGTVAATGMAPIRGFTTSMLERGAEGIYLFNHFDPVETPLAKYTVESGIDEGRNLHDLLAVAGDIAAAKSGPRRHVLTFHNPVCPGTDYRNPLPAEIGPDRKKKFQLHIGPAPSSGMAVLRVGFDENEGYAKSLSSASVNSKVCPPMPDMSTPPEKNPRKHGFHAYVGAFADHMAQFQIPIQALQGGYNTIEVGTNDQPQRIVWVEILIEP